MTTDEQRVCRNVFCMAPLTLGAGERESNFAKRRYCSVSCAAQGRETKLKGKRKASPLAFVCR